MAIASDNKFPKVILEERASNGSDTGNPAADHRALFLGEDGLLHLRDSSGTVTDIGGSALSSDIVDALTGAASPDAGNVFATMDDVAGGGGGISGSYVGYNTVGASEENMAGNQWYLKKITLASAGFIPAVEGYFGETSDSVYGWMVAVFADSGGNVAAPLGMSPLPGNFDYAPHDASAEVDVWLGRPVGVWVPAGGDVWIGAMKTHQSGGDLTLAYDTSGTDRTVALGGAWATNMTGRTQTNTTRKYSLRAPFIT